MSPTHDAAKLKLAMLEVARELGNVSKTCKLFGYSRDSFYRIRDLYEKGGEEALDEKPRRTPNLKNRVATPIENEVLRLTHMEPLWGQVRVARAMRRRGMKISPSGVRCIWVRHGLETVENRLKAIEPVFPRETAVIETTAVD